MHDVFSLIYAILIISIFYALLKERRDPAETMAWMLIIMLLPAIGILAYILFGRSWRKSHEFSHKGSIVPQK
ncbi:MAG TPA: cardiolipin synthase, partial [Rikenellaceae bacterium]|nr:cardiolipin synthase [Rikenellaceae bacterium]